MVQDFRELRIWQNGMQIVKQSYLLTKQFPKEEIFGLVSQVRRAAVSIPSNVAEGFARNHDNEYRQFLYIALGSCAELETHFEITKQLNYCKNDELAEVQNLIKLEIKMILRMIKSL
ncbi:MAG: four helix bundle protein [Elusimicrobia bacterium]|nr:four helix bundle protein [Elusimicrobiota bacterium]